jgi:hypothetical protein
MAQAEKKQRMSTDEYCKKLEKPGIRRVHEPGGGVSFLSWLRGSTRSTEKVVPSAEGTSKNETNK